MATTNVSEFNEGHKYKTLKEARISASIPHNELILVKNKHGKEYRIGTVVGGDRIIYLYPYISYDFIDAVDEKYYFIRVLDKTEFITLTGRR